VSTVVIRPSEPGDRDALGRLAGELVRLHSRWNPRRFLLIDDVEAGYGAWLSKEARSKNALVLVAERDDEVVGYAYARFEAHDWNALLGAHAALHDIYVAESGRGAGTAQALLAGVRGECQRRGVPRVVLHTAVQNEPGQKLFAKVGFEPTMIEMTWELDA